MTRHGMPDHDDSAAAIERFVVVSVESETTRAVVLDESGTRWTRQPEPYGWTTLTGWPANDHFAELLDDAVDAYIVELDRLPYASERPCDECGAPTVHCHAAAPGTGSSDYCPNGHYTNSTVRELRADEVI